MIKPLILRAKLSNFHASVVVTLRPSVLDTAGEAAKAAASRWGVEGIKSLRIGKSVEIDIEAPDETEARRRIELLSDRLLANPVIEDWTMDVHPTTSKEVASDS